MKKILISDTIDKRCLDILSSSGFIVDYSPDLSSNDLINKVKDANALVVRSSTQVNSELIDHMQKMEIIGRAGTGVDNIDVTAATRKGILVMNTPGGNTISAAEHTMALMLAMCRNISQSNKAIHEAKWERKKYQGTELLGKTLGLIGLGKIGKEVAKRSKAFGMNILAFDPLVSDEAADEIGVKLVEFNELISKSDILSLHSPLIEKTKYIISEAVLSKTKPGVKILNCARGGLIDEKALLNALNSGRVSAAGLDVFENEPPDFSNDELIKHPAVVCTPHLGASTEEAQRKVAEQISNQITDYFKNSIKSGAVNASVLKDGISDSIKPWIKLADVMGRMHAQILTDRLKSIALHYYGESINSSSGILTSAFLKGLLSVQMNDPINLINAPLIAEELGFLINETKSGENFNFNNLITVTIESNEKQFSLSGTIFGNNEPRIVNVIGYHVEFKPEGNILIYSNIDRPGMLSAVSNLLAVENINIAGLSLGRLEAGKDALTIVNVDSQVNKSVLNSISSLDGIKDIFMVCI
jgi:D-3-phosphoglycerate dehydrogenase / 2-oxoglutarate reductase